MFRYTLAARVTGSTTNTILSAQGKIATYNIRYWKPHFFYILMHSYSFAHIHTFFHKGETYKLGKNLVVGWWWSYSDDIFHSLQWRHNVRDGVSNHQPRDCLLKLVCRRRSKKTSKLRATGLYEGNALVTGEFTAQRVSNAENVAIWWRHQVVAKGRILPSHHAAFVFVQAL